MVAATALLAAGCGSTGSKPEQHSPAAVVLPNLPGARPTSNGPAAVIASVRRALHTDRIYGVRLHGSRLVVKVEGQPDAGEGAVSHWYLRVLATEVGDRLGRPLRLQYRANLLGGPPLMRRNVVEGPVPLWRPREPLAPGACRKAADSFSAAPIAKVEQLDVLGGACVFEVHPGAAYDAIVADDGAALAPLRDLPGGPNAHFTVIEVVDPHGAVTFVTWTPPAA